MKKLLVYLLLIMISIFSASCSFLSDKPSDSQIKKDVEEYFARTYKPLQINNIYIKGIIFAKEKVIASKIAVAIVRVETEFKADYKVPPSTSFWGNLFSPPLDKNHKKGEILLFGVQQKYCRSDRAWLPYKITSDDISIIDESGKKTKK